MMRNKLIIIICTLTFIISSCDVVLKFDGTPPKVTKENLVEILKEKDKILGVFQLKTSQTSDKNEIFKNNDFKLYSKPSLKKSIEDTLSYLGNVLLTSQFVEITNNGNNIHYEYFNGINKSIYDAFFSKKTRQFNEKNETIIYKSEIENDTLIFHYKTISKVNKKNFDTLIKIRCWEIGELICFQNKPISFFSSKMITSIKDNDSNNYFSFYNKNIYIINKDSLSKKDKYSIYRLKLNNDGFSISGFYDNGYQDSLFEKHNIEYKDSVIHYTKNVLDKLINSEIEEKQVDAIKIKNFPLFIRPKTTNWINIILITLGCILIVIFITKKLKHKITSP